MLSNSRSTRCADCKAPMPTIAVTLRSDFVTGGGRRRSASIALTFQSAPSSGARMVSVVAYKLDELALATRSVRALVLHRRSGRVFDSICSHCRSEQPTPLKFATPTRPCPSEAAHKREDNDDQKYKAQSAAGVIAPARAVGPGRKRTDQQNDDQDKSYGSHVFIPLVPIFLLRP